MRICSALKHREIRDSGVLARVLRTEVKHRSLKELGFSSRERFNEKWLTDSGGTRIHAVMYIIFILPTSKWSLDCLLSIILDTKWCLIEISCKVNSTVYHYSIEAACGRAVTTPEIATRFSKPSNQLEKKFNFDQSCNVVRRARTLIADLDAVIDKFLTNPCSNREYRGWGKHIVAMLILRSCTFDVFDSLYKSKFPFAAKHLSDPYDTSACNDGTSFRFIGRPKWFSSMV